MTFLPVRVEDGSVRGVILIPFSPPPVSQDGEDMGTYLETWWPAQGQWVESNYWRREDELWALVSTACGRAEWQDGGGRRWRRRGFPTFLLLLSTPPDHPPPPNAANFSSVFFLLLLVTWLVNAKNCGSHAVRRPLPRFLRLAFYTPITGLRSSVGVSLQLLVCSDAQRCLIFDEALFINQPPPLPPVATWQIFIGKTSRKTRRSWEAVHQNAHALFFCFSFRKRTPTFTALLIVVRCSPELEAVKLIFFISGVHSCFSPFLYFFLSFCFSPGSFLFVLLL